jgi:AraC-like DNA-binding protein
MPETLRGGAPDRLERSCIRFGTGADGIERADVFLAGLGFEPHRHDTYAIGITQSGVQSFRYRGARRICLPGQLHVLHPDEEHDGAPATGAGLGYRILYLAPGLVSSALGGRPLPFVAEPVGRRAPALTEILEELDAPLDEVAAASITATVADLLVERAGGGAPDCGIDLRAVELARDYLTSHAAEQTAAATLERVTGTDRFTLARHFRRALGTSPDRYRLLRRVALARTAIESGRPLARAAAEAGFADQSHLTRQFKRSYGLTPAVWARLVGAR